MRLLVLRFVIVGLVVLSGGAALAQRTALLPPTTRPVRVQKDQVYANVAGRPLLLDIYLPADARKPVPLVMYLHGGDWMYGDRRRPPVLFLLNDGIAVASIDYRLAPRNRFPAQIRDCRDALLYLKSSAKRYAIDAERIGVIGESAGGHLAALLATSPDEKAFIGTRQTPDARVQAVCAVSGPMDIAYLGSMGDAAQDIIGKHPIQHLLGGTVAEKNELANLASPVRHITKDTPPFLLIYGDQDFVVFPIVNRDMAKALGDRNIPVESHEIKGMGHDMLRIWDDQTRQWVRSFFRQRLAPAADTSIAPNH